MKWGRRVFTSILVVSTIFMISGCSDELSKRKDDEKDIVLITKMNTGYYWGTVKTGADVAARELKVNVEHYAPREEDNVKEQIALVNQAVDRGIDALILAASDFSELDEVIEKAYDKHIPVIIIDSEVNTNKTHCLIVTNNVEAGENAGNMLVHLTGEIAEIGLCYSIKGATKIYKREQGLESILSNYPKIDIITREYCYGDIESAYKLTKRMIIEHSELDAIVTFDVASSEGAARAINEMELKDRINLIAFGNTVEEINYLEKGDIKAMVIENPFSIGYLAVKYAVDATQGKKIPEKVNISSMLINKENMYLPENQKLLFPFNK